MRTAIVSDIHGNLTALDAVIADLESQRPDLVLHGGDLVLSGPRPAEVLDRIRQLGWPGVLGNTDELLWRPEELGVQKRLAPKLHDLLVMLFESHAPATRQMLGADRLRWLQALAAEHRQSGLVLLHASPGNLWRAPGPDADERALLETYGGLDAQTVVYGHIHQPYVRVLDGLTVANSGSTGMPSDGDPRAAYLLVEEGAVSVRRVEYDLELELDALERSGYPCADWIAERWRTGRYVRPPAAT